MQSVCKGGCINDHEDMSDIDQECLGLRGGLWRTCAVRSKRKEGHPEKEKKSDR
jgi:hypothetical protein